MLSQHLGHFNPESVQASTWIGNQFIVLLDGSDDMPTRISRAKALAGPHAIIDASDFVGCEDSMNSPGYDLTGMMDYLYERVLFPYQVTVERPDFPLLSG